MANISTSQHRFFSQSLDDTIKKLEFLNSQAYSSREIITALKKELFLLECLFAEYDSKTKQLKQLIREYQKIQRSARVKLRTCQQICAKH